MTVKAELPVPTANRTSSAVPTSGKSPVPSSRPTDAQRAPPVQIQVADPFDFVFGKLRT